MANAIRSSRFTFVRTRSDRIRRSSCLPVPRPRRSRSSLGAVAVRACSWLSTRVRSATAERRAIRARMACGSRGVGMSRRSHLRVHVLRRRSASMRLDLPARRARRWGRSTSNTDVHEVLAESGAPIAGAFDPEHQLTNGCEVFGRASQLCAAGGSCRKDSSASICPRSSSARAYWRSFGCRPRPTLVALPGHLRRS